jgi:septum formation protein
MKIILASKSPRRKEILENLGVKFDIITADTDESSEIREPSELVRELALRKGVAVAQKIITEYDEVIYANTSEKSDGRILVISSDTVVAVGGEILGKPSDLADAHDMLSRLEGRDHSVFSGIAVILIENGKITKSAAESEETIVRFAPMTDDEIEFYVNNESVLDKAGAYAIQGIASAWIEKIDGDYFNVVGLPVRHLFKLLSGEFNVTLENARE